jgi:hypothetical protein
MLRLQVFRVRSHMPPFGQSASALHCTHTIRVVEQCGVKREQSMSDMQPAKQRWVTESQTGAAPIPVLMQSLDDVH